MKKYYYRLGQLLKDRKTNKSRFGFHRIKKIYADNREMAMNEIRLKHPKKDFILTNKRGILDSKIK